MLQKIKQAVLFQFILHVHIYGSQFSNFHAVKSNVYADESCIKIEKTESTLICFAKCMNFPNSHSLFCYNGNLQSCMCCNVSVANGVQSLGWEAYTIREQLVLCEMCKTSSSTKNFYVKLHPDIVTIDSQFFCVKISVKSFSCQSDEL